MSTFFHWPAHCLCGHDATHHTRGTGRCHGLDSYGLPCTCPSLLPDKEDEQHDDSDDDTDRHYHHRGGR